MLGIPIIISDKVGYNYKTVQKKTSKFRLLNKIYKKLFGVKQIKVNNGQVVFMEDKAIMNQETFDALKKGYKL